MRIVAVADTHTFHDDLRLIPNGNVFIHAGDLCHGGRLDDLRSAAAWLRAFPHRHKIVVAGNHD
jgi:3',5'-cyclic AMP phosphodiesterase CpdA